MGNRKDKKKEVTPIKTACICWLDIKTCFCRGDETSIRYSVRKNGEVHSRWETLNEALIDGRKGMKKPFDIYDNVEKEVRIKFE